MNIRTTSGQIEIEPSKPRQLDTASHATHAFSGPVVALAGLFQLRSPASQHIDEIVRVFMSKLEAEKETSMVFREPESKVAVARALSSALASNLRERTYPFNLFNITRPSRFASGAAQTHSLLAWSVGFGNFPVELQGRHATRETLKDFERLRSASDCVSFAQKWGRLGSTAENLYFIPEPEVDGGAERWLEDLFNSGLWSCQLGQEGEHPASIPLTGEPLDAWLWHSERLRSWRILLRPLNTKRAVDRAIDELARFTDVLSSPGKVDSTQSSLVCPSAREGFRSVLEDEISTTYVEPWTYAFHQEGGEFYFAGAEFTDLRRAVKEPHTARGAEKLELALKVTVAKLLRRTLAGHIHLLPRIGIEDREVIQSDSLLAWLYMVFAREFAFPLGAVQTYVDCIVCGKAVSESPHARNKRRYCGGSCQKLKQRHGLDEARRRVKTL